MNKESIPRIVGDVKSFPPETRVRVGDRFGTVKEVWTIGSHLVLFDGEEKPEVIEKFRMERAKA